MSISADHMSLLLEGGKGIEDFLVAARAMERGDDYRSIAIVIDAMREVNASPEQIAEAVMAMAHEIVSSRYRRAPAYRDGHSSAKDSNKARRGLSNEAWRTLREQIFERDGYECQYCGETDDLTCDHILPLIRGGTNDHDNLTTACRPCNSSKGGKTLSEWRGLAQ